MNIENGCHAEFWSFHASEVPSNPQLTLAFVLIDEQEFLYINLIGIFWRKVNNMQNLGWEFNKPMHLILTPDDKIAVTITGTD